MNQVLLDGLQSGEMLIEGMIILKFRVKPYESVCKIM